MGPTSHRWAGGTWLVREADRAAPRGPAPRQAPSPASRALSAKGLSTRARATDQTCACETGAVESPRVPDAPPRDLWSRARADRCAGWRPPFGEDGWDELPRAAVGRERKRGAPCQLPRPPAT